MAARTRPRSVASASDIANGRTERGGEPAGRAGDGSAVQAGLPEAREIRRQQMAALIRQTPVISAVSMANSLVTALAFWAVSPRPVVLIWLVAVWILERS